MKPFDLALAQKGHKVVTREGLEYKFGIYDPKVNRERRVLGWIKLPHNSWMDVSHDENGNYCGTINDNPRDLFMAEPEYWVNIYSLTDLDGKTEYKTGPDIFDSYLYASKAGQESGLQYYSKWYRYFESVKITPTNTLK
jgi:hypothetical protein